VDVISKNGVPQEVGLPSLATAGVVVLLISPALASSAFAIFERSVKTQVLDLTKDSIRAVIALSLVV
jgi:hypothetical protein